MRPIRNSFVNKERHRGGQYTTQHFNPVLPWLLGWEMRGERREGAFAIYPGGVPGLRSYTAERGGRYSGRSMKQETGATGGCQGHSRGISLENMKTKTGANVQWVHVLRRTRVQRHWGNPPHEFGMG